MRKLFFPILILFAGLIVSCGQSGNTSSQQNPGQGSGRGSGNFDPQAMVNRQMEEMKSRLDLSGDQEKQIREIMTKGFETMRKAREEMQNSGGGFEGMREQMQQMREEQNNKIKAILSEEQWDKYQVLQEEMRARRGQGRGGSGGQGGSGQN